MLVNSTHLLLGIVVHLTAQNSFRSWKCCLLSSHELLPNFISNTLIKGKEEKRPSGFFKQMLFWRVPSRMSCRGMGVFLWQRRFLIPVENISMHHADPEVLIAHHLPSPPPTSLPPAIIGITTFLFSDAADLNFVFLCSTQTYPNFWQLAKKPMQLWNWPRADVTL